ncbi:hypothetical protein N8072_00240 [bacterium]|jgi:hypothetical protein|nr:hypothetical protein [bacterium]MDB4128657.1 hypothetical protein [bacterium]MDC1257089.1 hypothetical protein [bacterium]
MTQAVDFKIEDVLHLVKNDRSGRVLEQHVYHIGACVATLVEILFQLDLRHDVDYFFEGSYIDQNGIRWVRFEFNDPESAMMVKIRGVGK